MRIGIIGAGIFGLTAAFELAEKHDVVVFERQDRILAEASTNNHLRHHIGYHYPRSHETVQGVKDATGSFEEVYGDCIVGGFPAYYAVSKYDTMTDKERFLKFCREEGLPYREAYPFDKRILRKERVELCTETPEKVYDMELLNRKLKKMISEHANLDLRLGHRVVGGSVVDGKKIFKVEWEGEYDMSFDVVINATYSYFNNFNGWFGFSKRDMQYELLELLEIRLPISRKFGITVMDGKFPSILPRGSSDTYTLGHVDSSVLAVHIGKDITPAVDANKTIKSNRKRIIQQSAEYLPIALEAEVVRSMYVTRVVKPYHEHDDARPTEITDYGDGFYSVFGGKIITAVQTARRIRRMVEG